uniref:Tissue factor pathway inhibitor n=1 Tax=Homo sapiens TaxID=9606 RepID=UPI00100D9BBF|nr:Chain B, Tissue factor pathway inhibitor [Homo sapiens]6BX8_D Chain D, Tissue factor pathway inhibitor [Homo sapiens]6BX8_F Chain F, Tissue factor pathway inhibitor [Homo sapiens]6BX8_H Chain H, Tissue factor pathway inhibitor [Homo sapiens]
YVDYKDDDDKEFMHSFCAFKADDGPCRACMKRFFFNIFTRQCEEFCYGGCEGNQNRFESLEECKKMCTRDPRHHHHHHAN